MAVGAVVRDELPGERAQRGERRLRVAAAGGPGVCRTASERRPIDGAADVARSKGGMLARTASRAAALRPRTRSR